MTPQRITGNSRRNPQGLSGTALKTASYRQPEGSGEAVTASYRQPEGGETFQTASFKTPEGNFVPTFA